MDDTDDDGFYDSLPDFTGIYRRSMYGTVYSAFLHVCANRKTCFYSTGCHNIFNGPHTVFMDSFKNAPWSGYLYLYHHSFHTFLNDHYHYDFYHYHYDFFTMAGYQQNGKLHRKKTKGILRRFDFYYPRAELILETEWVNLPTVSHSLKQSINTSDSAEFDCNSDCDSDCDSPTVKHNKPIEHLLARIG